MLKTALTLRCDTGRTAGLLPARATPEDILPHPSPLPPRDLSWHVAQATRLDPHALAQRARKKLLKGDIRAAICYLEAQQTLAPDADLALHLAALHRQCRAFARALAHLKPALARWPARADLLRPGAEIATLAGDHAFAAKLWDRLAGAGLSPLEPVLRAIGCLREIGDEARVSALLERHQTLLRQKLTPAGLKMVAQGAAACANLPQGLYLVTGNNGTGKTRLGHFLQTLGFRTVEADIEIGCYSHNGRYADLAHDLMRHAPPDAVPPRWIWPRDRVAVMRARMLASGGAVFIVGGHGQIVADHVGGVERVIHLHAPTSVIAQRLARRASPSHRVGSQAYDAALRRNRRLDAPDYPVIRLRADRPVWKTCAEMLHRVQSVSDTAVASRYAGADRSPVTGERIAASDTALDRPGLPG